MKHLLAAFLLTTSSFALFMGCGGKEKCVCNCTCDGELTTTRDLPSHEACSMMCEDSCPGGTWSVDSECKK